MRDYTPPKSIKLIEGKFAYDETVTLEVDGKLVKRKVHYGTLDGLYVVVKGEKIGFGSFDKEEL